MVNLFWGCNIGYKNGMVHRLLDEKIIDFCITDYVPETNSERNKRKENEHIITIHTGIGIGVQYDKIVDVNLLPALSQELIEAMLPYESMAIKMGIRRTNFPVCLYEEEKRNYYLHLRFWDYVFNKYKITHVFFENTPHTQHKYVIYALARIKKIPILTLTSTVFSGFRAYGTDLNVLGDRIKQEYIRMNAENFYPQDFQHDSIKKFYDKVMNSAQRDKMEVDQSDKKIMRQRKKEIQAYYWGEYIGTNAFMKYYRSKARMFIVSLLKYHDIKHYTENKENLYKLREKNCLVHFYKKYLLSSLSGYNKLSSKINWTEKYIYFALQLSPEETTLPKAGVWVEQYNSIQLLARAVEKYNVYVYVKEHYLQYAREKIFYQDLLTIPNVRLVNTNVNTIYVIKNSIAVASQTGSCLLEGPIMGKPAIAIGDGCAWKGMPGLYVMHNETQGTEIIKEILNEYKYDRNALEHYFMAIDKG